MLSMKAHYFANRNPPASWLRTSPTSSLEMCVTSESTNHFLPLNDLSMSPTEMLLLVLLLPQQMTYLKELQTSTSLLPECLTYILSQ